MKTFWSLSRVLDGAIILAVVTQAVSLADLVLLPEQKKRLESWCDEIALRLDYIKTFEWLQRWLRTSRRARIAEVLFVLLAIGAYVVSAIGMATIFFFDGFSWTSLGILLLGLFVLAWTWSWTGKIFSWVGGFATDVLAESKDFSDFLLRYGVMMIAGIILLAVSASILYWITDFDAVIRGDVSVITRILGNVLFALLITWILVFADGMLTLIGAVFVWMIRVLVVTARATMWRIARYPKGPVAALMAIVGGILAVARFSIKP